MCVERVEVTGYLWDDSGSAPYSLLWIRSSKGRTLKPVSRTLPVRGPLSDRYPFKVDIPVRFRDGSPTRVAGRLFSLIEIGLLPLYPRCSFFGSGSSVGRAKEFPQGISVLTSLPGDGPAENRYRIFGSQVRVLPASHKKPRSEFTQADRFALLAELDAVRAEKEAAVDWAAKLEAALSGIRSESGVKPIGEIILHRLLEKRDAR